MDKVCKNCKYFHPYNDYEYKEGLNDNLGFCEKSKWINDYRDIKKFKEDNVVITASEFGDDTEVLVGINFGCIHWEELFTAPSPDTMININNPFDKEKSKTFCESLLESIKRNQQNNINK